MLPSTAAGVFDPRALPVCPAGGVDPRRSVPPAVAATSQDMFMAGPAIPRDSQPGQSQPLIRSPATSGKSEVEPHPRSDRPCSVITSVCVVTLVVMQPMIRLRGCCRRKFTHLGNVWHVSARRAATFVTLSTYRVSLRDRHGQSVITRPIVDLHGRCGYHRPALLVTRRVATAQRGDRRPGSTVHRRRVPPDHPYATARAAHDIRPTCDRA